MATCLGERRSLQTLVSGDLFGSAPFNEVVVGGAFKEDNHMPILPTMTCPKQVLELILLLILLENNVDQL